MGNPQRIGAAPIHSFYSSNAWIEGNVIRQLEEMAAIPGMKAIAAMPDLHVGKYGPVGCALLSEMIHPQLVGSDIGCGMALFQLDTPVRKLRLDQAAERLAALEGSIDGNAGVDALAAAGLAPTLFDSAVGTVGGGNHFCELQAVEQVFEAGHASQIGLDPASAVLLVHSGSRGLGYSILQKHLASSQSVLDPEGDVGQSYMVAHDHAVAWAKVNRLMIARRAAAALRADLRPLADISHNFAERVAGGVLHRKGAATSSQGPVPVPGSRGTLSYLVSPSADAPLEAFATMAHGAGRKYDRSSMHGRVRAKKSDLARLERNPFGGYVLCSDRSLMVEEAPEAYKSIDSVMDDIARFNLGQPLASFRPLVTFKTARDPSERSERQSHVDRRKGRQREDWR